jgi:hypothetical protein
MWQDRAGYLRAFSGYRTIKKVPKERGTRSNAGLGAQDILFSSHHSIFSVSFVLRICSGYDFVMIIPYDLSADRWLDVSFVLDGFWAYGS